LWWSIRPGRNCAKAHHQHQRDQRCLPSREAPDRRRHAGHRGEQPEQWPGDAHQPLGQRRVRDRAEHPKRAGEAGIDQPRPVRLVARNDARLGEIVPAASAEPVAQLRQAHRVVGVDQREAGLAPVLHEQLDRDEQPAQTEQQGEDGLTQRCGHRAQWTNR
jgi:hypothetical protein